MRNSVLWYGGGSLVVVAAVLVGVSNPTLTLAAMAGIVGLLILLLIPRERVAGLAGCAALSLLVLVPVQNIGSYGSLKYGVLAAVALLAIVALLRRPDGLKANRPALVLFVAYFVLVALVTPNSQEPAAWTLFTGALIAGLGVAVPFAMMGQDERKRALNFVVWLASAQALYALAELVMKLPPLWADGGTVTPSAPVMYNQMVQGLVRSEGTLGHPLPLALLALVGIALVIRGSGPRNKLVKVAALAVLLAGCFAAGSRSALLVAIVLICLGIGRARWKALVVGGWLLGIAVMAAVLGGILESRLYQHFVTGDSLTHRSGALEAVPRLLTEQDAGRSLFGNGYFSAYQIYRRGLLQSGDFFAVDNQFVMTLVEGGIVGLIVLAALIILALRHVGYEARLGLLAVVFFFSTFDVMSWPSGMALFAMFIGLASTARPEPVKVGAGVDTAATSLPSAVLLRR